MNTTRNMRAEGNVPAQAGHVQCHRFSSNSPELAQTEPRGAARRAGPRGAQHASGGHSRLSRSQSATWGPLARERGVTPEMQAEGTAVVCLRPAESAALRIIAGCWLSYGSSSFVILATLWPIQRLHVNVIGCFAVDHSWASGLHQRL